MKRINYVLACMAFMLCCSCSEFLDTYPYDAMSPATTWKTEDDAEKFLVGCYDSWLRGEDFVEWDCYSDIGFSFHSHEGMQVIGNGSLTASNPGKSLYSFTRIRRCITFLDNIDQIPFADESKKKDLIAQARIIRAYDYFKMNLWYGGVPIIKSFKDGEEAKVPRNKEDEVKDYVYNEIDLAVLDLNEARAPLGGRIRKGAALALKMRSALYWEDYERALDAARAIKELGQYSLHPNYADLFTLAGRNSEEIILSVQHLKPSKNEWLVTLPNNADGGWSSMVPTQNLIDMYEMANGLTKDEVGSEYDPTHPFAGRDPRMAMTVLYPGQDWVQLNGDQVVLNTLNEKLTNGRLEPQLPRCRQRLQNSPDVG